MDDSEAITDSPTVDLLREFTTQLWALSIIFYGAGDLITTAIGLRLHRVAEAGPIAARIVDGGPAAVLALKISALTFFAIAWYTIPKPHNIGVPLALATFGIVLTIWNLAVIIIPFL